MKTTKLTIRLDPDLMKALKIHAAAKGVSIQALVVRAISKVVSK
jgi:predicted HicB family RNase H-like nuclease